jgi:xanthine dehydrogenase accessory factor
VIGAGVAEVSSDERPPAAGVAPVVIASLGARIVELVRRGRPFAIATVVRTHGSTPQVVGARLVVTGDEGERPAGTLGGGCVEGDAIEAAREVLARGGRQLREYRLTEDLAWNSGLVCGGTMWILIERSDAATGSDEAAIVDVLAAGACGTGARVMATRLARDGRGFRFDGRIAIRDDGSRIGTLGDAGVDEIVSGVCVDDLARPARVVSLDAEHDVLIEPLVSRPRLVIAGGGHVAQAIARQASLLDFDVTILEDRPAFSDPARFAGATVLGGAIAEHIAECACGPGAFLIIATRGHKLDAECVLAAARSNARYIGLLGSRRKTILIERLLRDEGIDASRLDAIHAPVGLDFGGRTPAEIALAVMAEITQIRYGGTGHPLRNVRSSLP